MGRVVITGMGVVSCNGVGLDNFINAIRNGISGLTHHPELERLKFSCTTAGTPNISEEKIAEYLNPIQLRGFNSSGILYGVMAGMDAWRDAGLAIGLEQDTDFESGTIFGAGTSGVDKFREAIYQIDEGNVRRLGSSVVNQIMNSGVSAFLGGILSLGNQVSTNSSACATGVESILTGYDRIKSDKAKRMLVGSCSDAGPYAWGGFDSLRVTASKYNNNPEAASRPMSASAAGFVPSAGAGAMVIEDLEMALTRGAKIYGEILGGCVNSGGQRNGGTMTAPNSIAVRRCITDALWASQISGNDVDYINGHLTATVKDGMEIANWCAALGRTGTDFPYINSLKSLIGHSIGASGTIESVATVLQLQQGFIFGNRNCEDLHPDIAKLIDTNKVLASTIDKTINIAVKASFGFGDVNACVIFKKY
ncbi:MAG: beta-ketoacyl-[acyl-carrier-protein] synthase family protein [Chitinophagaceae bacterium]